MLPEQYPAMFRALPIPCLILDKDFIVREMTDIYLKITHRSREEMHRKNYFDIFTNNPLDPERVARTREVLEKSLTKVRDELKEQHLPVSRFDLPDAQGNMVTHYWTSWSVPLLDPNGDLLYILHRVEDITAYVGVVDQVRHLGDSLYALSDLMKAMLERSI